ncbi:TPA: ABC transporter ATP-binding protein [Candidatus Saccharibacteria bacterium]|nr:ABC transporter ATP-binding protein [Candidatus Saccharibacteria bacterium]HIO87784.1 ABC transporter ATP-binding protein [Candidatus Saccharibacteria bacterium]
MSLISIAGISKTYGSGDAATTALDNVSLEINKGELVAIMGPSGSGKSTLMNIIGLLDRPTDGVYKLQNKDVSSLKDKTLAKIRRDKIGFIFQSFNLLQRHSALENVALPMVYTKRLKGIDRLHHAADLLESVGLEDRLHHMPNELSGGQMQRVAIARSLANNPSIILADEPTGNLDSESGKHIMELLKKLNDDGNTIIMVTHDKVVADQAHRIIQLEDGKVVESAPAKEEAEDISEEADNEESKKEEPKKKKADSKKNSKKTKASKSKKGSKK